MAKKRKSGGRKSGKGKMVQCSRCHRLVPEDKAKKETKRVSFVDRDTEEQIIKEHGYVQSKYVTQYYCISCAVHTHRVNIRPRSDRDSERKQAEQKAPTQKMTADRIKEEELQKQRQGEKNKWKKRKKGY